MWLTRALLAGVMVGILAGPAGAESTATICPPYGDSMVRAREALQRGDRDRAITALHEAQAALAQCMRHEAENADEPVFLVDAGGRPLG